MAVDMEQEVMRDIGLSPHYHYFNGSGSCQWIRKEAIEKLPGALEARGLSLSIAWAALLRRADLADSYDGPGQYSLTNVWIACSYAIQDALYRQAGGEAKGVPTKDFRFHFFYPEDRKRFEEIGSFRGALGSNGCYLKNEKEDCF
jgi:hypothetical protein